jgi:UDP-N-acetylmuramate: L-alanyl-gamma-D-glutamyl-meso-diaminopimelate ligase
MRIHFIAIGGAVMHNLAIALHKKGYRITGSDDEIVEPSHSRLAKVGLLPAEMGWNPLDISAEIDAIVLGMHARLDNPELLRAQELGLKIYSYPEYIYEQTKDKIRIVVGGSHGKTTITAMILHVLNQCNMDFDYLIGAQVEGFDTMVQLTHSATLAVLEGDEYLASPIDRRSKFLLYKPSVALLSGIAWDHINVFPTYESYIDPFKKYIDCIEPAGALIYCKDDRHASALAATARKDVATVPYSIPPHRVENGITYLDVEGKNYPLQVYGDHNLMNLNGARLACNRVGVTDEQFYNAITSFKGAAKRLELIVRDDCFSFYKDFAHSPSKVTATIEAVKKQFPQRQLTACLELHTFSSLNEHFLDEYALSMKSAHQAIVYFNPHTLEHKKLKPIDVHQLKRHFQQDDLIVFTDSVLLKEFIQKNTWKNRTLLMMSSGTFNGFDFKKVGEGLLGNR